MSKKIYVGNLSWNTTESDPSNLFAQYGEVLSARIITDRDTNRSKGFMDSSCHQVPDYTYFQISLINKAGIPRQDISRLQIEKDLC